MDKGELNIPSTVNDPHYRYKMPRIQTAVQGSGNGIKTNWVNLPDVSNALKVPLVYPIRFIRRELGANTDIKQNSFLINGNHTTEKMPWRAERQAQHHPPHCWNAPPHHPLQLLRLRRHQQRTGDTKVRFLECANSLIFDASADSQFPILNFQFSIFNSQWPPH